jgi:Ran-binding protein 1
MADSTTAKPDTEQKTVAETVTDSASNAAASVASAASAAKDNMFSMFGGGPKKEKKVEEDVDEPSGSSKAKKDAEEVRSHKHMMVIPSK